MGFAGEKGSSTGLHHDYHDNIYIVMKGKKKFEIYSPGDADKLTTYG
jgi:quercetin dioxygenase-like cupin family protein